MMYGHYRQVSDETLEKICKDRDIQKHLISSDGSDLSYGKYLCIGIYWHAIEFLINGSNPLQGSTQIKGIVYGGEPLDQDETTWFDFGPIRYFTPIQVQEIAEELTNLVPSDLVARYSQATMAEHQIHPDNWWEIDQSSAIAEIEDYYARLVDFFREASEHNRYVITYITGS